MVDLSVLSRVSSEEGYLARNVLIVPSSIRWFCVCWKGRRERYVLVVRLRYIIIIIIIFSSLRPSVSALFLSTGVLVWFNGCIYPVRISPFNIIIIMTACVLRHMQCELAGMVDYGEATCT